MRSVGSIVQHFGLNFLSFIHKNANVSTNSSSKSVPDFLVVTKLNGISVSSIPKSFSRVCDLRLNSGYFRQICRLHECAINNKEKKTSNLKNNSINSLLPRTDRLLVATDDPRIFLAAHVYCPVSL